MSYFSWCYIRLDVYSRYYSPLVNLGSLLFLLFINDIVLDIESNIRLFADGGFTL